MQKRNGHITLSAPRTRPWRRMRRADGRGQSGRGGVEEAGADGRRWRGIEEPRTGKEQGARGVAAAEEEGAAVAEAPAEAERGGGGERRRHGEVGFWMWWRGEERG